MKKIFSTSFNQHQLDLVLLAIRITIACFMLVHGIPKLGKFFAEEPLKFGDPIGIGMVPSLVLTVFAEVFCSVLIFIGLGTRLAVIPLIITMLVAAFVVHATDGFGKMELPLLYVTGYLFLLVTGSGRYSIDRLLQDNWKQKRQMYLNSF
jgi:putative oxidoreductase